MGPWMLLASVSCFIIPTDSNQRTVYAEAFRTYPKTLYLEHPEEETLTENKPSPTEIKSTPRERCMRRIHSDTDGEEGVGGTMGWALHVSMPLKLISKESQ